MEYSASVVLEKWMGDASWDASAKMLGLSVHHFVFVCSKTFTFARRFRRSGEIQILEGRPCGIFEAWDSCV